jgi:hypothetical protein
MHWLTAIFGFLACYFLAGLGYTLALSDAINDASTDWFWALAALAAVIASGVNELLARRRAAKKQHGSVSS